MPSCTTGFSGRLLAPDLLASELQPYGIDVYATVPSIGCSDSVLGCPDVKGTGGPLSERRALARARV